MRSKLQVMVSDQSSAPYAEVPCECMWDLIEYLSYHRITVKYDFKSTHFTVAFPKQSASSAQELLNNWVTCSTEYAEMV